MGETMCAFEHGEIEESNEPTFKCIKCKDDFEFSSFFKHDDPTFDYGFYVIEGDATAIGVQIVEGVDLCKFCVPQMNPFGEKKND